MNDAIFLKHLNNISNDLAALRKRLDSTESFETFVINEFNKIHNRFDQLSAKVDISRDDLQDQILNVEKELRRFKKDNKKEHTDLRKEFKNVNLLLNKHDNRLDWKPVQILRKS